MSTRMEKMQRYIVVDDDRTNNLICDHVIRSWDPQAEVELYQDPEEALKKIAEDAENVGIPAVLFLDVNMPAMSGWEFLDVFETFPEEIRNSFTVYILTSSIEDFDDEAKRYPFVSGFLSKPLRKHHLDKVKAELVVSNSA